MFDLMPFDYDRNFFAPLSSQFFQDFGRSLGGFRTDIQDAGDRYILEAELPGFAKEDLSIDLNGDLLTIRAQHKAQSSQEKKNYLYKERRYGTYARSFRVSDVNTGAITAKYSDGILTLEMPKLAPEAPRSGQIAIQ